MGKFLLLTFLVVRVTSCEKPYKAIILIGILYGLIHFYIQKRWWYHSYPAWAFYALFLASILPQLQLKLPERISIHVLLLLFLLLYTPSFYLSKENIQYSDPAYSPEYQTAITQEVNDALESVPASIRLPYISANPRATVQFFDFLGSELWNVAYRNNWIAPSRHIYPYPFYNIGGHSEYMTLMSQELYKDLLQTKPLVIIISNGVFPAEYNPIWKNIDYIELWETLFSNNYVIKKSTRRLRIYARIK